MRCAGEEREREKTRSVGCVAKKNTASTNLFLFRKLFHICIFLRSRIKWNSIILQVKRHGVFIHNASITNSAEVIAPHSRQL